MIKKLRRKFIWIAMSCVGVIFCLMLLAINLSMTFSIKKDASAILKRVVEADGSVKMENDSKDNFSARKEPENPKKIMKISNIKRTFAVKLNESGEVIDIVDNGSASFSEEVIKQMAEEIWEEGEEQGVINKHQFLLKEKPYGTIIAFIDCTHEMENTQRLVIICLSAGIICIGILLITVIVLSYWAVRPVEEGFKRQKQFVTDASHELKTPLSVISANTSVMESLYGENQWTGYIQSEIGRMSRLINDMLKLAKMEQPEKEIIMESFDFSKMSLESLLPYESLAYEQGKQFGYEVEEGINYTGNRDMLIQMIHIFVDNAFKYSGPGGEVKVVIKKEKKKIWLQIFNTGEGISKEVQKQMFDRFYRGEASHSRKKEGYGLGLSIASVILEHHHGKVHVKSDEKTFAAFEILL